LDFSPVPFSYDQLCASYAYLCFAFSPPLVGDSRARSQSFPHFRGSIDPDVSTHLIPLVSCSIVSVLAGYPLPEVLFRIRLPSNFLCYLFIEVTFSLGWVEFFSSCLSASPLSFSFSQVPYPLPAVLTIFSPIVLWSHPRLAPVPVLSYPFVCQTSPRARRTCLPPGPSLVKIFSVAPPP